MSHSLLKRALPALPRSPSSAAAARCLASVTSLDESSAGAAAQAARAAMASNMGSGAAQRAANPTMQAAAALAGQDAATSNTESGRPQLSIHQLLPALQFSNAEIQNATDYLADKGLGHRSLTWDQRVIWGDHDQFGHVNHVRFVQWFESARAFYFNKIYGPDSTRPGGSELSIILGNLNIRYRRPVQGNDMILIGQGAVFPLDRPDRFVLRGTAYSLKHKDVVSVADQTCVIYNYNLGKPVPIPATQLALMREYAVGS